jgi:hypothetical protein
MSSFDTRTTAAYLTEDGEVQPATVIWQQRKYTQRVWNRLLHWQDALDQPLQWSNHTTNTLIAPLHTYGTTFLDLEWGNNNVFAPEFLRTETIGRQVGCIPFSHYPVYGTTNALVKALPKDRATRIDWGMKAVHEIRARDQAEGAPRTPAGQPVRPAFGYGSKDVIVHNYWDRKPVAEVSNDQVRWIVFERPKDRAVLMILQSYSPEDVSTKVRMAKTAEIQGGPRDAETGETLTADADGTTEVKIPGPFGTRIISFGNWEEYAGEIPSKGKISWKN